MFGRVTTMAVGDVVTGISSLVATTGILDIRPAVGVEWVIHNVLYNSGVELWKTDGTTALKYDTDTTLGGRFNVSLHCTNGVWYQIKNTSASAVIASYDGVQTK